MGKRIILADPRGFCAGVDRAILTVQTIVKSAGSGDSHDSHGLPPVYVRRQIVHNRHVVEELASQGAVFVEELDEIPDEAARAHTPVVFSAHGVSPLVKNEAKRRGLNVIDATLPAGGQGASRGAALRAREGYEIVYIGHLGHDEAVGVVGRALEHVHLIEHEGDVAKLDFQPETKLVLLTQTTLSVDETADTIAALRARFPWIEMPPSSDICYATSNRQAAVKLVAEQSDCVVIVGSANSSNSVRLMEVGQEGLDARFSAADAPAKTGHAVRRIVWTMPANSTRHGSKAWRQWGFPRGIRAGDVCAGRDRCAAWHGVYGYGIRETVMRTCISCCPPNCAARPRANRPPPWLFPYPTRVWLR